MIKQKAKDEFWAIVEECLVEIFDVAGPEAARKSRKLRKTIEQSPPEQYGDIFYHAEPIHVAEDIVGRQGDLSSCRDRYEAILARHEW